MRYYSTKNKNAHYSLREAVLKGLPADNGLFMPESISVFSREQIKSFTGKTVSETGFEVCRNIIQNDIPEEQLQKICSEAFNFPVPLVQLNDHTFIAELFHGPTLAFKDFGARFMARLMSFLNKGENKKLTILVATSGDTGGAVADGFFNVEGIEVFILYPSGGVSDLQEKQLTTYGGNIHAIEVKGTFDDCQALVKMAFLDAELSSAYRLTSANSINISRLIPQAVYYFTSVAALPHTDAEIFITVPSGNFGNLTAGIFAMRMGLPVSHFAAATNINDIVPEYLEGKGFHPRPSEATISNAMDVGNPSNFGRLLELFHDSQIEMSKIISGLSISDEETITTMKDVFKKYSYTLDPHGAVGIAAWEKIYSENKNAVSIVLETAHPAKFIDRVEEALQSEIVLPPALERLKSKTKKADLLSKDFSEFKKYLLSLPK